LLLILGALTAFLTGCGGDDTPPPPPPSGPTQVYLNSNMTLEALGLPTNPPGPDVAGQVETNTARTVTAAASKPPVTETSTRPATSTSVAGIETDVFNSLNGTMAALGTPTMTQNPYARETSVQARVDATLTGQPTPMPSNTPRFTNTPRPGFPTEVFNEVNELLEEQGKNTNTPSGADAVGTAAQATENWTWRLTNTPPVTSTP
jgi:hypothetical protein